MSSATERPIYAADLPALTLDEKLGSLFQPDMLLSAQYFQNLRTRGVLEPEKKLMLAVLEDAVNCFQDNVLARGGTRKRLFDEVEEWFTDDDDNRLFSFENICEELGLNHHYVRQGLRRWRKKEQFKSALGEGWEKAKRVG